MASGLKIIKEEIANDLKDLIRTYEKSFKTDHNISDSEANAILNKLKITGSKVTNYLTTNGLSIFAQALKILDELQVKNIIIHTDEYAIPWTWAYYHQPSLMDFGFLCKSYPCGMILLDEKDETFSRLKEYQDYASQAKGRLAHRQDVCLIAGTLGMKMPDSERDLSGDYVQKLVNLLGSPRALQMRVRHFGPEQWKKDSGQVTIIIGALNALFANAQVIHFAGHVVEGGKIRFDENTVISTEDLKRYARFDSSPLVVIHGFSCERLLDIREEEAKLSQAFLDLGASGCLIGLIPGNLNLSIMETSGMIELFYKHVMNLKPYGQALREACREYQTNAATQNDPQWLFFRLFGDPRAKLKAPKRITIRDIDGLEIDGLLEQLQSIKEKAATTASPPPRSAPAGLRVGGPVP
jgi:hypothetical protein